MCKRIISIVIAAVLVLFTCTNITIIKEPIQKYLNQEYSFTEAKDAIAAAYPEELSQKYWFINLNGLFVRLTGSRVCNETIRLKNGMLTGEKVRSYDVTEHAEKVVNLAESLTMAGIDFYYIQSPSKIDLKNTLVPKGAINYTNDNADAMFCKLEDAGVNVLDLRPVISDTPEHIEEYYYKTDHHWNALGAFKGFQVISEYLQEQYPEDSIIGPYQDINNWDIHRKKAWFLGSQGKRTGIFFAGTDDLVWLTPEFDTEMSFANVYRSEFIYGDYYDANIREKYINEKDYFNYAAYNVYIGGDYPLVQHRNNMAPVDKKVLIVKDSYVLPLQTFFSTVFKELDVIDLRHYESGSLDEYIFESRPDIVIMNFSSQGLPNDEIFGPGTYKDVRSDLGERINVIHNETVEIKATGNSNNNISIFNEIKADKTYTLSCNAVDVTEGDTDGIELRLYDRENNTYYDCAMWDLAYCKEADSYEWTFKAPHTNNDLELLIFSGISGNSQNSGIRLSDLSLDMYL